MEKKDECCTPKGQVPRYVDCIGCDKKPIEKMSKQTAVEWFIQKDSKLTIDFLLGKITQLELAAKKATLVQQAKQMEREQIEDAFVIRPYTNFEKYYNETYGG
jgi:hypothetical protein